jgi:hypothetical protein
VPLIAPRRSARMQPSKRDERTSGAVIDMRIEKVGSTRHPRITHLRRIGGGEGFGTCCGGFERSPAFIVDCGTMGDVLNEEDRCLDSVTVRICEDDSVRARCIDELRRESPAALGSLDR